MHTAISVRMMDESYNATPICDPYSGRQTSPGWDIIFQLSAICQSLLVFDECNQCNCERLAWYCSVGQLLSVERRRCCRCRSSSSKQSNFMMLQQTHIKTNSKETGKLKTVRGHITPPQQRVCNGRARPGSPCGRVRVGTGQRDRVQTSGLIARHGKKIMPSLQAYR